MLLAQTPRREVEGSQLGEVLTASMNVGVDGAPSRTFMSVQDQFLTTVHGISSTVVAIGDEDSHDEDFRDFTEYLARNLATIATTACKSDRS